MTRNRLIASVAFALVAWLGCVTRAFAAPPYDVSATISAPTTGGPVDSYTLVLDGADVGPVNVGANSFPALLPADGTYVFRVRATNAAGSALSAPVTVVVAELEAPGEPGLSIQVQCQPQCVLTITQ